MRLRPAATAVLVVLAFPAAAQATPQPRSLPDGVSPAKPAAKPTTRLRVGGLSRSVASVVAGRSLQVRGRVRNRARRAATPTVSVFLQRKDAGRIALGAARIGRVGARRSGRFTVKARVPSALGGGRYALLACVRVSFRERARCATAPRRLRVIAPGPAGPPLGSPANPVPAPSPASTPPPPPPPSPTFTDGARSLGDSLFPTIGNGGYDARDYALDLSYDPATQVLLGTSTMTATATQGLRSFSLDLQGLQVSGVTVAGAPAFFAREGTKLVVTPVAGIPNATTFATVVTYGGVVEPVIDPDGSTEGFIPTDTGAVVVCEPLGAQGWFPNNNVPDDKATMDLEMTVPLGKEVIGNGALVSRVPDATTETFHWREAQPMATYLSTATIGDYRISEATSPGGVPLYMAVDTAANGSSPAADEQRLADNEAALLAGGPVVDLFAQEYGAYPFETSGGIIANAPEIGYQLEVQGRPVYTTNDAGALVHELAHQWYGNDVTLADWSDIWLNEGFAVWSEWLHEERTGGDTTAEAGAATYALADSGSPTGRWRPLIVTDPAVLFGSAPYDRGGTLLEALRQRIGDAPFRALLQEWLAQHAYGNGTTAELIALAQSKTGEDLAPFFEDWLFTDGKPTTTPPAATYTG